MKEKILNNLSLKILSAICAIILWAVIVNIYDPSISVTVSGVSVSLLNEEALTDKGYTYEVVDGNKISVYIKGPRSIVGDIKASDIMATADLREISGFADYVDIDVKIVKDGVSSTALEITPKTTAVKLDIENREVKTLDIDVEVTGTPTDGYSIITQKISPTTVKISGASSAVASVERAKVVYDVSGISMNINDSVSIQLIDSSGNIVNDDRIEMNRKNAELRITLQLSKSIPLTFKTTGTPASGYALSAIQYSANEVMVVGEDSVVQQISSIDIPASLIDLTGISADKEYVIDLTNYIPEGVKLVSDNKVKAVAKIIPIYEKEFVIDVDKINIINIAGGTKVSFGNIKTLNVIVIGSETVVNSINVSDLNPTINMNNQKSGTANAGVSITVPTGCRLKQEYTIAVSVLEKESSSAGENMPQTATN